MPNGTNVYLAYRKLGEIFRSGKRNLSEAIREGVAAWAIDEETLRERRLEGIKVVGVLCKESDDIWLAPIERFFDTNHARIMNYESRGGALQRYLPLKEFKRKTSIARP
ncbi:hypothetical protein [Galbibacter sp. BG1]